MSSSYAETSRSHTATPFNPLKPSAQSDSSAHNSTTSPLSSSSYSIKNSASSPVSSLMPEDRVPVTTPIALQDDEELDSTLVKVENLKNQPKISPWLHFFAGG